MLGRLILLWGFSWDSIVTGIKDFFYGIFFEVDKLFLWILDGVYAVFGVFVGIDTVSYNGTSHQLLINIFFGDSSIAGVYKGMALIGMAMAFLFAIFSVMKKAFDINEKIKSSLTMIVGNLMKSILLILLMTAIIIGVLNTTNVLMQQVTYVFNNAPLLAAGGNRTFTDIEYAQMARILDTIGNYSLNPSKDSRYNINSCYNEIRKDMLELQDSGVFNFSYESYEISGDKITYTETTPNWQYILTNLARSRDLSTEMKIDEYDENMKKALEAAMDAIETMDTNFRPLQSYKKPAVNVSSNTASISTIVFLAGTMSNANNNYYNQNGDLYDALRSEYMNGRKSIYDFNTVKNDFNVYSIGMHLLIQLVAAFLAFEFLKIAMNCVSRIFNMILLYLAFPPIAATMSLDEGAKVKQWTTAFVVQSFSVFGTLISVRLMILFIPVIFNSSMKLFDNSFYNFLAKILFLVALGFTVEKAGNIITGILADQAGFQSVTAGSAGSSAASATVGAASNVAGKAFNMAKPLAGGVGKGLWNNTAGRLLDKSGFTGKMTSLKNATSWMFGEGSTQNREKNQERRTNRKEMTSALKSSDASKRSEAREKLSSMSNKDAKELLGMNEKDFNAYKAEHLGAGAGRAANAGQSSGQAAQPPIRNNNNNNHN